MGFLERVEVQTKKEVNDEKMEVEEEVEKKTTVMNEGEQEKFNQPTSTSFPKTPLRNPLKTNLPTPTPTPNKLTSLPTPHLHTPFPTPPKPSTTKRPLSPPSPLSNHPRKKQIPPPSTSTSKPVLTALIPKFSIQYTASTEAAPCPIAAIELKRAAESVLRQVDWEQVGLDVASNRGRGLLRRAVRGVLQEKVDELFRREREERGDGGLEGERGF